MLAEKIRQAVIEESHKNMFTLRDLQKSYKKVHVFDKLDDLVKHLQDVAQENINNDEKNVKQLPMHKELMESLLYEDKQNGGVLENDKIRSKYLVAESDFSSESQLIDYLSQKDQQVVGKSDLVKLHRKPPYFNAVI